MYEKLSNRTVVGRKNNTFALKLTNSINVTWEIIIYDNSFFTWRHGPDWETLGLHTYYWDIRLNTARETLRLHTQCRERSRKGSCCLYCSSAIWDGGSRSSWDGILIDLEASTGLWCLCRDVLGLSNRIQLCFSCIFMTIIFLSIANKWYTLKII